MTTTNVPLPVFTLTGLQIASEQDILTGVLQDYVAAFALSGKTLSPELTTPQGQLAQSQAYIVAAFQAMLAQLVANVDPLTSSGAYQDALGRIYFLTRKPATFATVVATVTGIVGAELPAGSQVKSSDGTIWASQTSVIYGLDGSATVTFQATVAGPGPVAAINDLSIYQQVNSWVSVSNAVSSIPGTAVESRAEFEVRRQASVSIGGMGQAINVRAAVANVTGVSDCYVYNNGGDTPISFGTTSYPIPAHSIAVSVTGGTDQDVALAINSKLDCGCGMSTQDTVNVAIQDTVNYIAPYPTYTVRFVRPAATQVYFTVNVADLSTLPADYVDQVQTAIVDAFTTGFASSDGTIVLSRARIGGQIVAAEFAGPLLALDNITPVTIFVSFTPMPASGNSVTMGIDQQPVCLAANVTVSTVAV